ncbi:MAG: glycosyltransferase, partial [Chloroflexota bacterium]
MRVVHIIKIVLTAGAERHLLRLLPGLRARDVDARLIVLVQPDTPMDDFMALAENAGIPAERMIIHRHADVTLLPRLVSRLRELQPELVHTHLIHADLYGVLAAKLAGVPRIIISRHNDNAFRRKLPVRLLNRVLWGLSSGGIAISEALRRFCIEVEGVSPGKIRTVHYGLDLHAPSPDELSKRRTNLCQSLNLPDDAILVGTVSRLIEQKGLRYAINAFQHISGAYLVITGDGTLRDELEAQADELDLRDRVFFLGWREDASDVMTGLDVFLMPSLWEGFGLVLLEAMSQGLPVVASRVSAIPEIVTDGKTGILLPPRDHAAIATALQRLIDDPQLRERMG